MRAFSRAAAVFALLAAGIAWGQFRGFQAATVIPPAPMKVTAGQASEATLNVRIRRGYHVNSDKPAEEYMIPTRLSWNVEGAEVSYPEAEIFLTEFSDEALLVYSGSIEITTAFPASAKLSGLREITGTLRYQACTEKACLAPTSVDVTLPLSH